MNFEVFFAAITNTQQISAQIGGDLRIESLQDSSQYTETSKSAGGSVMIGAGGSGSLSLSKSSVNSNYQSVGEQSALRAGDGGFQVSVKGNTTLIGGQITSTDQALDQNDKKSNNTFQTGGTLTTTDLQNSASFEAKSVSVGTSAAGFGSDKGSASSTTTAGISGIAGNKAARTGDAQTGLKAIFDKDQVKAEISAQTQITAEFGKQASKAVGDYAQTKLKEAQATGDQKGIDAWKEGGSARVALHAVVGGLTGGISGAAGAAAASAAAPSIDQLQSQLQDKLQTAGLSPDAAKAVSGLVGGAAAATVGAAASGGSITGATSAFNADMNNRQLHPSEQQRIKDLAADKARVTCRSNSDCEKQVSLYWIDMLERAAEGRVDTQEALKNQAYYDQVIAAAGKPTSQASMGAGERFFNDLGEAQRLLNASAGGPIVDAQGRPVLGTDGKPQTYFSATQAQKDNAYGNLFPGGSPSTQASVIPGKEQRDQTRLERLNTPSGLTTPDTTLEEALIGVRLPSKGTGAVVQVTERNAGTALVGTAKATEEALLRSGGAFDSAGNPLLDMSKLSSEQKRLVGEQLFGPNTVKQIVPDGQQIARVQGQGSTGIDALYKVNRADVDYVNIEYKFVGQDNKTGAQVLGSTSDGKQGSLSWMGGSGRIENAVGVDQAIDVNKALRSGRIESWVVTVRPDGSTAVQVLDALGKPKPTDASKIILPNVNLSGAQK